MISKFEEWRLTTPFADEAYFESYVKYLEDMELPKRSSMYVNGHQLKHLQTTPLMSRLNHTRDDEDLSIDVLILEICWVDVVIIHKLPYEFRAYLNDSVSWTMTELKQSNVLTFRNIDKERSVRKVDWDDKTFLNVWSAPLHLRAVTYGDKDFRKEYEGGYLVYEGNQYGDTSDFYIIGSLTPKENEL